MKKQTRGGVYKKSITFTREELWYVLNALHHVSKQLEDKEQDEFMNKVFQKVQRRESEAPHFLGSAPQIKFKIKVDPEVLT